MSNAVKPESEIAMICTKCSEAITKGQPHARTTRGPHHLKCDPREPFIELSVRVSDGSFEGNLCVPVDATPEQRIGFAKMWVDMMASTCGVKFG